WGPRPPRSLGSSTRRGDSGMLVAAVLWRRERALARVERSGRRQLTLAGRRNRRLRRRLRVGGCTTTRRHVQEERSRVHGRAREDLVAVEFPVEIDATV